MFHRSLLACALVVVFLATLAPAALAAAVRIRVEGQTQTIFGAAQPTAQAGNALEALELASLAGEFYYHVQTTSFGPFVDQIGRFPAAGANGWVFKVNGALPPVGADKVTLRDGDVVLWYFSAFTPSGAGSPTLDVQRDGSSTCYRVTQLNDQGVRTSAAGAVLLVDGRRVSTRSGRGCVGKHRGLVRATLTGAVRSHAVR